MSWDDDIGWLPQHVTDETQIAERTIKLGHQIRFSLNCDHHDHPEMVTFAEGAILGGAMIQNTGVAVVRGVFYDHAFRFEVSDYEIVR